MAKPDPNSIGEDWLKVSEARYDSMKHLLQSVKQDIEALTQKIDSTQPSPILYRATSPRSVDSARAESPQIVNTDQPGGFSVSNIQSTSLTNENGKPNQAPHLTVGPNQPDILANVNPSNSNRTDVDFPDLELGDEYMDIRIRDERNPFNFSQNLIDCTISSASSDQPGTSSIEDGDNKTWRSPSDFSLRDPFEEEQLTQEFQRHVTGCNDTGQSGIHIHTHIKETDLDDVQAGPFDREDESDGSLSPAVSPTFEIYAAETVQLKDMLLSNEETAALGLKTEDPVEKTLNEEGYQVYDNGHSLTTIDEASDEVDDWSSSDLDSSLHSNEEKKDHVAVGIANIHAEATADLITIDKSLKSSEAVSAEPHDELANSMQNDHASRSATLKKMDDSSAEQTFMVDSNAVRVAENNMKPLEAVLLRPKHPNSDVTSEDKHRQSQRPTSMGSLRGSLKLFEKSPTGSLHSVISAFSQESMISEADSYVTVCSRLATTGSDEFYTTACSDSELPTSLARDSCGAHEEECPTLSRKRTKLARGQRTRARGRRTDHMSSSSSDSSIEDHEGPLTPDGDRYREAEEEENTTDKTLIRTPQPVVVTPKFSRLPSKLASPNDLAQDTVAKDYPVNHVRIDLETQTFESQSLRKSVPGTSGEIVSHKRAALQRPVRQSPLGSPEPLGPLLKRCDQNTDSSGSDESVSSSSSCSGDEADYDASDTRNWTAYPVSAPVNQPSAILPPNLVYKPSLQAQYDLNEIHRKRLSRIEEAIFGAGGSSANEGGESDSDEPVSSDSPRTTDRRPGQSSDERQSDSGVVIIPKYSYQPINPEFVEHTTTKATAATKDTNTRECSSESLGENTWASTQSKPVTLTEFSEPISEQPQQPVRNELTNPKRDKRTINQSESRSGVVFVPPLAGCMTSKPLGSVNQQITGSVQQQSDHHTDGDRPLESSIAYSSEQTLSNELDGIETEPKFLSQTDMYANSNYFYPPEVLGSAHIYNDRVRSGAKPNGHAESLSQSFMRTGLQSSTGERTVLPLAAVLSSAEATAARPSVYSPLPSESDDSHSTRHSVGLHQPKPALMPDGLGMRISREEFGAIQNSSRPMNSSNDRSVHASSQPLRQVSNQRTVETTEDKIAQLNTPTQLHANQTGLDLEQKVVTVRDSFIGYENSQSWSPHASAQLGTEHASRMVHSPQPRPVFHGSEQERDIQAASQRTSRILHGNADYVDASVRLVMGPQVPIPLQPERSYIASPVTNTTQESGWQSALDRVELVSPGPTTVNQTPLRDLSEQATSPDSFIERSVMISHGKQDTIPQISHGVQLMHAPKHTSTPNESSWARDTEVRRLRNISPSPPRTNDLRPLIPKSLSLSGAQTKWQLRPIPTETEIRERLRSRSRQRAEERQSRAQRADTSFTQTYRPRSSRSDSRYRCTDLDSAIAESRADTAESGTMHSSVHESEFLSETKQSSSLFDLDANPHKPSKNNHTGQIGPAPAHNISTKSEGKFFTEAKSYNSLLETDIDTGENFERPLMLETDVDRLDTRINNHVIPLSPGRDGLDNKTQSLFNLTFTHTPGQYRRQNTSESHPTDHDIPSCDDPTRSPGVTVDNWQRTKSLQGLPHRSRESPGPKSDNEFHVLSHQSRANGIGAKGLIERLRDRAKSSYELRIAQSLTKLHVPDWLDKAECLNRNSIHEAKPLNTDSEVNSPAPSDRMKMTTGSDLHAFRVKPLLSSTRSLSTSRKPADYSTTSKWLRKSPIIETVAEPTWPRLAGSVRTTNFVRPSQQFRERGDSLSRLKPIRSKLYSSMRSLAASRPSDENQASEILRPQVAPRMNRAKPNGNSGQGTVFQLSPQDFMPRHEQLWGRNTNVLPRRYARANTEPRDAIGSCMEAARFAHDQQQQLNGTRRDNYESQLRDQSEIFPPVPPHQSVNTQPVREEDIKPADYDSGTEHSSEHGQPDKRNGIRDGHSRVVQFPHQSNRVNGTDPTSIQHKASKIQVERVWESSKFGNHNDSETNRFEDGAYSNPTSSQDVSEQSDQNASDWRSIDAEGESESEATDGLDQISDLTCLTNLIDTCATRHRALLANRPSALEHLLTSLGWWPLNPSAEHQHLPPTAAEAISIAAHEFDVDEDSHREEFLQLLQGPESRRPINLGEFALNNLSGSVQRKQHDGLLYISCGRAECMKSPIQVQQATDWRACANCYTLYCSTTCRALDRRANHDHPTVCSFARAKRVCNRVLRSLAPGQITGLTALAKTGMARLGRGGILLPFALIRHAELFLKRAQSNTWNATGTEDSDTSLEKAVAGWEQDRQPSPGGLIAPPLYLTLQELQELDSTVATPCRTYAPSTSMVLIIVVCAYELIARSDGRPVHLFKQSLILPFPAHNLPNGKRQSISNRTTSGAPVVPEKPALPQTNGLLGRPDRQAAASREAYMIRLQRMLRERGVSLRHHHPEIYTQVANFVETGVPFSPIRIQFHDFILREMVLCVIRPMHEPQIYPLRQVQSQASGQSTDMYEEVHKERSGKGDANPSASGAKRQPYPVTQNTRVNNHPRWQETNF